MSMANLGSASGLARKRLHIITWGCQMNAYDSGRMSDVLAPHGYDPVESPDGADLIILNTCHIRDKAAEKVFSELGRLRRLKDASKGRMVLAVAGCVAQAEGAEIFARAPYVDIVLGPQTYHRLPEMLAKAARTGSAVFEADFPAEDKFDHLPEQSTPKGVSAFLTVQEGCDKFCSFCVVPYTRGAEQSRSAISVLNEARRLIAQEVREITLLGQNVNAWRGEAPDGGLWAFKDLLRAVTELPGLIRLRYSTSHPCDMDDGLIAAHRDLEKLAPFLHLPVQSGSDRILAAMNRKHTSAEYRRLADCLRAARPDLALSSDFIVGYPGETDADFDATLRLVRDVGFAQAYSFKYSPRPGTPAAGVSGQIPENEKDARLQALQALLRRQQFRFNAGHVGSAMDILFTGPGRHPGQIVGRSQYLQPIHVAGPASIIGQERTVRIREVHANSLSGTLEQERQSA